jgi:hypothetical protein
VGVGTTAPSALFHVAGTSAPSAFFDVYSNSLGALPMVFRTARGTVASPTAVQAEDILGGVAVRAYTGSGFSGGRGQVMFKAAENWTTTANGTYLSFATEPLGSATTASERMRITPPGKIGVGTTAPATLLDVNGDLTARGTLVAKYQDVAEWVASDTVLDAGTVVVVDPNAANGARAATGAYDEGVAGAVSAKPGLVLGERGAGRTLMARHTN